MKINRKTIAITLLSTAVLISAQSFTIKDHDDKAVNLQVLPKNTSEEDLHKIMREYSMSLGVRCNFCHVSTPVEGKDRPKMDFASDAKHEKVVAREMMKMTAAINAKYIDAMPRDGKAFEQVTCVTCHNGHTTPIVSVDSLPKKEHH